MPDRIVADDGEHGQVVSLRDEMAGSRVVKHISSVTNAGNHGFLRVSEFHAQGATNAPAQTTGGGTAKITCGLTQAKLLLRHTMIIDDEGIAVSHLVDAVG